MLAHGTGHMVRSSNLLGWHPAPWTRPEELSHGRRRRRLARQLRIRLLFRKFSGKIPKREDLLYIHM